MKLEQLVAFVQNLHDNDAIHKKRGFRLKGVSATLITNHLLEEVVELQAEAAIEGHRDGIVEEAADTLAVFLHLLNTVGVDMQEVVDKCYEKLDGVFTYDESEVLTDTPGPTRRHREGSGNTTAENAAKARDILRKQINENAEMRQVTTGGQGLEDLAPNPISQKFHRLWTKAVGSIDYDKSEWQELATMINALGGRVT